MEIWKGFSHITKNFVFNPFSAETVNILRYRGQHNGLRMFWLHVSPGHQQPLC